MTFRQDWTKEAMDKYLSDMWKKQELSQRVNLNEIINRYYRQIGRDGVSRGLIRIKTGGKRRAEQINWRQRTIKRRILQPDAWFYSNVFNPVASKYRRTGRTALLVYQSDTAPQISFLSPGPTIESDNFTTSSPKSYGGILLMLVA